MSIPISFIVKMIYPENILDLSFVSIYSWIVFIFNFIYGLFATSYTYDSYVTKKDYWKAIIQFEFIKKVLLIGLPILFFLEVLSLYLYYTFSILNYDLLVALYNFIMALFFGGVVRILSHGVRRDFRYYFAKGCCKLAMEKEENFKIKYLILTVDSYDLYLRRNMNHGIKEIRKVHSVLLSACNKDEILKSMYNCLDDNRFELADYLSKLSDIPDTEFFVIESILQKLKLIATFFAAAIPIVISIIQLLLSWLSHIKS